MAIVGPITNHGEIRAWAEMHGAVAVEVLPAIVDSVAAVLRLMHKEQAQTRENVVVIPWEEFFMKFDALGLAFVYDDDSTGYNEILQREEASPFRHPDHRPASLRH